jgi:hypothetical protein
MESRALKELQQVKSGQKEKLKQKNHCSNPSVDG